MATAVTPIKVDAQTDKSTWLYVSTSRTTGTPSSEASPKP